MFLALKPCTIAGNKYIIDDEVDVSMCSDAEIARLLKKRFIVKSGEDEVNAGVFTVPVITKDCSITVDVTGEQLVTVLTLIQGTAEAAIEAIKNINDDAILILIHRLDTRKSVQEAAKKKGEALFNASQPEPPKAPEDGEE